MEDGFYDIPHRVATEFLLPRHYSGRKPNICFSYGSYVNGVLKAVCTFGIPASPNLCSGLAGKDNAKHVIELNRLCREDDYNKPLSQFVSWCLKELKTLNVYVVSFSDTDMNHHGYIYQACNFYYTGKTKQRTDKYTEGNRHSRHYKEEQQNGMRKVRSSKYRYVYICAESKAKKREMLKEMNYPIIKEYPKGNNSKDYELGYILKQKIISKKKEGM